MKRVLLWTVLVLGIGNVALCWLLVRSWKENAVQEEKIRDYHEQLIERERRI